MTDSSLKVVATKETPKFVLVLKVTSDQMKLFLEAKPVDATFVTVDEIINSLGEHVSTSDINITVIEEAVKLLNQGKTVEDRRIIKGVAPVESLDGKLLLLVKKFNPLGESEVDSKGFSKFLERHLFDNIRKGQIVARVYPPKDGTEGRDVFGKAIVPKPGKPFKPAVDKTLALENRSDDGEKFDVLVATQDGFLEEDAGKLRIQSELLVKGNLDLHVGNIDFVGSVRISGEVMQGFTVKADCSIDVEGLRGGTLTSLGGDIVIRSFASKGKVVGGKSFTSAVIQELQVEVHDDIIIQKQAIDCRLQTERCVLSPTAKIVGGEMLSVMGIEVGELGNAAGLTTLATLCSDVETKTVYRKIVTMIESHEKAIQLIALHLGPWATNARAIQNLKDPHRQKMSQLSTKYEAIKVSKAALVLKQKEFLATAIRDEAPRVNIIGCAFAGAEIRAGDKKFVVKEDIKGPKSIVFDSATGEFTVGELVPLQAEKKEDPKKGKSK